MDAKFGIIIGILIGVITGLIVNYISPPFNRTVTSFFSWLFQLMNPDKFDLTGNWEQIFSEPKPQNTEENRKVIEKIKLKHVGANVTGDGVTDIDPRRFVYRCTIKHSQLFGEYLKKGEQGNISGSGMIQLNSKSRQTNYGRSNNLV